MKNKHLGSSFDAFLEEEGLYNEVNTVVIKRVALAKQTKQILKKGHHIKNGTAINTSNKTTD